MKKHRGVSAAALALAPGGCSENASAAKPLPKPVGFQSTAGLRSAAGDPAQPLAASPALSMRSAYSPMIQIMEALASGSSRLSSESHSVPMMLSYRLG